VASRLPLIGLILVILGILLFAVAVSIPTTASEQVPYSDGWTISATTIGDATGTLSWSGGSSGTNVTLYDCGSSCASVSNPSTLSKTAVGYGSSGTIGVTLVPGTQYLFLETNGSATLSESYSISGLNVLSIIGIVVTLVGTILVLIPSRQPPAPAEPAAAPADYSNDQYSGNQ
jgi:uncharacterized membrane protein